MYSNLRQRFYEVINDFDESLIDMAFDPRLMPDVASLHSSASTPSLRSRESTVTPVGVRMEPGGNVKVVVRVRAFLPRGK